MQAGTPASPIDLLERRELALEPRASLLAHLVHTGELAQGEGLTGRRSQAADNRWSTGHDGEQGGSPAFGLAFGSLLIKGRADGRLLIKGPHQPQIPTDEATKEFERSPFENLLSPFRVIVFFSQQ